MALDAARAKSLFLAASDLNAAERALYLNRECAGDAELRQRVEALLRANDAAPLPAAGLEDATRTHGSEVQAQTEDHGDPTARVGSILGGKYKLIEEIGEGGMGSVYLAQQTEPVKRAVAVKVIKAGMDSKAVLARFEAERQALAMMDHPNIAKVLDAGTTDGSRPYFVMELVKGQPITKYCDERKLTPRQRLELFVPVCQAIQHAHQKGVIHRDIKPSNVIVAMYDDRPVPKVIDFGVAKAAGQTLTDKTLMTGLGAIVGTAEYMSPEQANLNNLDIDTRSDVYSLGVLIYELLTGTTPVDRKSLGKAALLEVLRIVREVDVPKPSHRLSTAEGLPSVAANRGTEPAKLSTLMKGELDWLVLKALEKDRTRRYETANALARDIQRYLADEIVEARPPSVGYRLKKFVRKNPLQLALAGTVALLLVGGGAVAWWQRETDLRRQLGEEQRSAADAARLARNAEAVAALLDQSEEALRANDADKAAVALEAARKRSDEGGAEGQAERLGRLDADLALLRDLDAVDQFRWTSSENRAPDPADVATRTREALARFGAEPEAASVDEPAARVSLSVVRERIVSALDWLLRHQKTAGVRAVLRRVDADPYRDAVRDAVLASDRVKVAEMAGQPAALRQPPGFVAFLGDSTAIPVERRRQLLQAAVSRRSGDLGLLMTLGGTYPVNQKDEVDERLRWYQAAVAAAPGSAAAHNGLGVALRDKKDLAGAEAAFRKAIELDSKCALAHAHLGVALNAKGQVEEAIACCRMALALDPKCVPAHVNLGAALCDVKRDYDGAIACLRKAIDLDPKSAPAHMNLGNALHGKGQVDAAIAYLRKAIELDPKYANAHTCLGAALCDGKHDYDGAIACFRKAIELDPKLTPAHFSLGNALRHKGQVDAAIVCYRKAIELDPKDAQARTNLGTVLASKGQMDEAIVCYRKAIELDPKNAIIYVNLGLALRQKGQVDQAIVCYQRAIELDPKFAGAHYTLGLALRQKGQVDEAIAWFKKAIELDPKNARAHSNLGNALHFKGQVDDAIACFKKAIALDPKNASAHSNLGEALSGKGQVDEAIACYKKAIELDAKYAEARSGLAKAERLAAVQDKLPAFLKGDFKPTSNDERLGLAGWCRIKKLYRTSAGLSADAFTADPKLADDLKLGHRYDAACSAALAATGQGEDAAKLDDQERARLRRQALDWLRADLALRTKQRETGQPADRAKVQRAMRHWQQDSDLAGLRDKGALEKLPAQESKAFTQLWADVAALLTKAEEKPPATVPPPPEKK